MLGSGPSIKGERARSNVNTLVILNPASGHGLGRKLRPRIERGLRDAGVRFDLVETAESGHAVRLGREAADAGVERVLAAGGDGTVHEVANGLLQAAAAGDGATRPALGTIPIGTGNDFAKLLKVCKLPPERAARRMAEAQVKVFDVGRVIGEYFDNSLGIGFDAEVARQANQTKRLSGLAVYVVAVYKSFVSFRAPVLEVTSTAHSEIGPMMMLECSIGISAGGGFCWQGCVQRKIRCRPRQRASQRRAWLPFSISCLLSGRTVASIISSGHFPAPTAPPAASSRRCK